MRCGEQLGGLTTRRGTTWLRAALWGTALVVLDQASKLAATRIGPAGSAQVIRPGLNRGLSLGLGVGAPAAVVTLAVLAVVLAVALSVPAASAGLIRAWAPGLMVGGAASNLLDRFTLGGVNDFIVAGPIVANVADVAVVVSLLGIGISQLRPTHRKGGEP